MKGFPQSKASLIREITAAFDGVSREDGITLHEAQALDDYAGPDERAEVRKLDTETRWQDVPSEDISQGDSVLSFLDPKGFRYYIPAFLIWYLTTEEDSNTYHSIEFHLTASYKEDSWMFCNASILNRAQSKAIAHFCVYMAAETERREDEQDEFLRREFLVEGWSEERINSHLKKCRPNNSFQSALNRYWRRFL